jgi:glutaredoxin
MEVDISKDSRAKQKIKNLGFKTVPQIFYPDGKHLGDYKTLESKYV